ncbi:MAG: SirB2 family protein [Gammaproteobacteria bacterium]|nr:SirB2 family protein [Gammaproteobacteria bacterium]
MIYLILKYVHIASAALTATMFIARGILMLRDSPLFQQRIMRIAPHAIDTVLLASALTMVFMIGWNPLTTPWLLTKLVVLFAYIGVGLVAMRFGKTKRVRATAWVIALCLLGYIAAVAMTKNVMPIVWAT